MKTISMEDGEDKRLVSPVPTYITSVIKWIVFHAKTIYFYKENMSREGRMS